MSREMALNGWAAISTFASSADEMMTTAEGDSARMSDCIF
jgi:hypothetical protein